MGLLSSLYGIGLSCKKRFYGNPKKLPAKVISIGNLTLGGTGKTPAVIAVAQEAKARGLRPCILTRGYKGKVKGPCFVQSTEQRSKITDKNYCTGIDAGDEPALMADILKDVPIVKCADRYKGGKYALNSKLLTPDSLFILDDGFQHWRLHRDVDVLLIDATNPFGNERLFPEGTLREPFSAMKRAHIIVITKSDMAAEGVITAVTRKIKQHNSEAPIFTAYHKPAGLVTASGDSRSLDTLRDKEIYAFSGIANPAYFHGTLKSAGARIGKSMNFRDHYSYSHKDMDRIKSEAAGLDIITTEKDLVKIRGLDVPENLSALQIGFSIDNDFYDYIFRRIQ